MEAGDRNDDQGQTGMVETIMKEECNVFFTTCNTSHFIS
jgi:hypothetical protein